MPRSFHIVPAQRWLLIATLVALAGCTIAKPRTDDPLEKYNRAPVRRSVSDFFTNIRMPVTVANDLLQARPTHALKNTGRFLINLTLGVGGFFDPASQLGLPMEDNDFGVTLARWGVPEGNYLMLPLVGPNTARDVWRLPVDSYFFDPLSNYADTHSYHGLEFVPQAMYLVTMRSRGIDAESFLQSAYDPYVFVRDAYRQYQIYDGNPPAALIQQMQGLDDDSFDPEELLDQQHQWEKDHPAATQKR